MRHVIRRLKDIDCDTRHAKPDAPELVCTLQAVGTIAGGNLEWVLDRIAQSGGRV